MKQLRGLILLLGLVLVAVAVAATAAPSVRPAGAAGSTPEGKPPSSGENSGPGDVAAEELSDSEQIEMLLDRLSRAGSKQEAEALERRIVVAWNKSGSDTVDLLLSRAGAAIKKKDYSLALQYLDTIVETMPDFAEGWNMRATVFYLIDEYELSLADIQHVLALQPRHFGALSGLGMIFRDLDEPAKALDAFRQVLLVHPYFGNARESVEKLEPEVEGRDI